MIKFSNNLRTTLAGDIVSTDTTISVASVATFPTLSTGDTLYLTLSNQTNTVWEIVICTAISGTDLTVTRGAEGTTPLDWTVANSTKVTGRVTAELLRNAIDEIISSGLDANFSSLQFTGGTGTAGTLSWNTEDETVDLIVSPDVTYQLGQELGQVARNLSGQTLNNGAVVRVTGASGNKITVDLASNNVEGTSSSTFAFVTETIGNNSTGRVTTDGLVRGLDTSSYTEGAAIWLGENGAFVEVKPATPAHLVLLGWVVRSHATEGVILAHVSNGWEVEELHDVLISNIIDQDILRWNSTSGYWENTALITNSCTTSATPPTNPLDGDKWVSTVTGKEYTYINDGDSAQWVELSTLLSMSYSTGSTSTGVTTGKAIAMAIVFGG